MLLLLLLLCVCVGGRGHRCWSVCVFCFCSRGCLGELFVCVCVFGEELSRNDKEKTTDEAKSNKEEP